MERFYFVLTRKVPTFTEKRSKEVYEAIYEGDGIYMVYWHEYGELHSVPYQIVEVHEALYEGFWKHLSDEEAEELVKGE